MIRARETASMCALAMVGLMASCATDETDPVDTASSELARADHATFAVTTDGIIRGTASDSASAGPFG